MENIPLRLSLKMTENSNVKLYLMEHGFCNLSIFRLKLDMLTLYLLFLKNHNQIYNNYTTGSWHFVFTAWFYSRAKRPSAVPVFQMFNK